LEERHPTFENPGMFWKALVNYGEYVAILQLGAIDFFHPIVKIEKPHEFTEGTFFPVT